MQFWIFSLLDRKLANDSFYFLLIATKKQRAITVSYSIQTTASQLTITLSDLLYHTVQSYCQIVDGGELSEVPLDHHHWGPRCSSIFLREAYARASSGSLVVSQLPGTLLMQAVNITISKPKESDLESVSSLIGTGTSNFTWGINLTSDGSRAHISRLHHLRSLP